MEIFAVKIRNRNNGLYRNKGNYSSYSKEGNAWIAMKGVKLAVNPCIYTYKNEPQKFIEVYKKDLDSDFIIMYEDGAVETSPVIDYFIDYIKRKHSDYVDLLQALENYKED